MVIPRMQHGESTKIRKEQGIAFEIWQLENELEEKLQEVREIRGRLTELRMQTTLQQH